MFTSRDCRHNLRWYLLFRVSFDFALWGPTWVLYMTRDLGLTFTQVMLLDLFFQTGIVLLEIPTGMLADALGRRWSLRGSALAMTISLGLWAVAANYWWVFGAWAMWAVAATLMNGADAALLYESLNADGRGASFGRVLGRFASYSMLGMVAAAIIGGWLAKWGYRVPIFAHVGVLFLSVFASFRLREPPRAESVAPGTPRQIMRAMMATLRYSPRFKLLLAYAAAVQVAEIILIIYQQPLLVGMGLPVEWLGWFYAVATVVAAGGPIVVTWVSERWGLAQTLGAAAFGVAISCLALFWIPGFLVVVPLVLARFLADGVRPPTIDGMNRLVGPRGRATVLSLRGISTAAVAGPMEVLSGWWADRVPLRRVYLTCGMILPLVVGGLGWLWKRWPERTDRAGVAFQPPIVPIESLSTPDPP